MPCCRVSRIVPALLAALVLTPAGAGSASAQDKNVLRYPGPFDPRANLAPASLPPNVAAPRLLLAGDSWAQYMWDDGTHNKIFDRYGQADRLALSQSLASDPGPGYVGPEYAISGSEARQWADPANYPWIANLVAALQANPSVDIVMLSIGGNDVLAGRPDGGWYKDMDLDVPGSEAALFQQIHDDTFQIIDAALAVRPGIEVLLSSYDYPNFNTGFWCFLYACPKREDLSRDPNNDLITDQELNGMMITVEGQRIDWTNAAPGVAFDNSVGLMHYFYGDGVTGPLLLPRPGTEPPAYLPFPGGNPARPTLRSNFRAAYDPIHLDVEEYEYKVMQQAEAYFLPHFRDGVLATLVSQGGANEGWTDGTTTGTDGIRVGDTGTGLSYGIVSIDTSPLPDGAVVTGARLYLTRVSGTGTNPFNGTVLGLPRVDVIGGGFGTGPQLEPGDAFASADYSDAGYVAGSVLANGDAVGVQIDPSAIQTNGITQFRISFPSTGGTSGSDAVTFADGDATTPPGGKPTLAAYMGTSAPFLDVTYQVQTGVGDDVASLGTLQLLPSSPNPFRSSTSLRFTLAEDTHVRLRVHDVQGRLVATLRDEPMAAGGHTVAWSGIDERGVPVPSGIYLAVLQAEGQKRTQRLVRVD